VDFQILLSNLSNPTLLFFALGIVAVVVKSDLEIPQTSARFIALYLLFSIGFRGGQELAHSAWEPVIGWSLVFGVALAIAIPIWVFFALRTRMGPSDAGATAAAYGSVSAVTFVAAISYLESLNLSFGGHMVAVMALMEAPAIVVGMILLMRYEVDLDPRPSLKSIAAHALTNGSVLMVMGSLVIGYVADTKQAEGIKPFTTDIFKGFLAIFLLDMGMVTARRFKAFMRYGGFAFAMGILIPAINGSLTAWLSGFVTDQVGDRFVFAILAASASYIAVPAAMRIAAPKADPGLYVPMALGLTFPFNITLGMPLYLFIVEHSLP